MNASEILNISITRPDKLFHELNEIDSTYKVLAKTWHPDVNHDPKASDVLAHINVLYELAQKAAKNGSWGFTNTLIIPGAKGDMMFPYIAAMAHELGELYITETSVIYAVKKEYENLYKQFSRLTAHPPFADAAMKEKVSKHLPQDVRVLASSDRLYLRFNRTKNMVRATDILKKGPIDQKHVAWMVSNMYNIACYLNYAGIKHLDFSLDAVFVDVESHVGALLGGWFYAGDSAHANIAAPTRTFDILSDVKGTKLQVIHSQQIKINGRRLLGANSIGQLKRNKDIPDPIKNWFMQGPMSDPVKEYGDWRKVLVEAYGPPKFMKYAFNIHDIYE